jgi:hypothetical protein
MDTLNPLQAVGLFSAMNGYFESTAEPAVNGHFESIAGGGHIFRYEWFL